MKMFGRYLQEAGIVFGCVCLLVIVLKGTAICQTAWIGLSLCSELRPIPSGTTVGSAWYAAGLRDIPDHAVWPVVVESWRFASDQSMGRGRPSFLFEHGSSDSSFCLAGSPPWCGILAAAAMERSGRCEDSLAILRGMDHEVGGLMLRRAMLRCGMLAEALELLARRVCPAEDGLCRSYLEHLRADTWASSAGSFESVPTDECSQAREAPEWGHAFVLKEKAWPNLVAVKNHPIVLAGLIDPLLDNYVEFESLPNVGRWVRLIFRGEVIGGTELDLLIRVVFRGEERVVRETSRLTRVSGRFEVSWCVEVPDGTASMSPRVSLLGESLDPGTMVAVYGCAALVLRAGQSHESL